MASKTLINGTGYTVKGGKTLIGGTGYSIKKGKTLINGTGYNITFGTPVVNLSIGASVYLNESGVRREWIVANIGTPSWENDSRFSSKPETVGGQGDTEMYANADGIWLLRAKCLPGYKPLNTSNVNFYPGCTLANWLNGDYFNTFDAAVRNVIMTVKVPYADVGSYSYFWAGDHGVDAKIFILSVSEQRAWGKRDKYVQGPDPGYVLQYFKDTNVYVDAKRDVTTDDDSENTMSYWTRDPIMNNRHTKPDRMCCIESGYWTGGDDPEYRIGGSCGFGNTDVAGTVGSQGSHVRPALVLPKNIMVDNNMNIIV